MLLSDHLALGEILSSGQLAQRLVATGLTADAARQAISRNKDPAVWVLPFGLPRRARLFTRRESSKRNDFYDHLAAIITQLRPGIARTIRALLMRQVLLKADAQRLLAAPLRPKKSRTPTYDQDVAALLELGFCGIEEKDTAFERLTVHHLLGTKASHQHARAERVRQVVNVRLTHILTDHFRKQGVISWNRPVDVGRETGTVLFNDYAFSAFSYSWLDPLVRRDVGPKPKPTPVLFDVLSRECDVHDIEGLLHRLRHIGANRNARIPLLGVIAAHTFTYDAWNGAKNGRLLAVNLRQAYGKTALKTLAELERFLGLAADDPSDSHGVDIDYDTLAADVEALRVHPHVSELRALGLEVATAVLLRAHGWEDVRLGLSVQFKETTRDVDVMGRRRGDEEIHVVECKAAHQTKELDPGHVRKFFTETVPAVLKTFQRTKKCQAGIWTTGRVGDEARKELETLSLGKRIKPALLEKADIISLIPSTLSRCKRLITSLSLPT